MQRALTILALLCSLIALATSLVFRNAPPTPNTETASTKQPSGLAERVQQLETRVSDLKAQNEILYARLTELNQTEDLPTKSLELENTGEPVAREKVLLSELATLKESQNLLEQDLEQLGVFEHFQRAQEELQTSYETMLDPKQPMKTRMQALGRLKKADRLDDQVIGSAMELWDSTEDGYARWQWMVAMEGVRDSGVRDRMLAYLPDEEHGKMRMRSVQTLTPMADDPEVQRWFAHLQENDPDPKVRAVAARGLGQEAQEPTRGK